MKTVLLFIVVFVTRTTTLLQTKILRVLGPTFRKHSTQNTLSCASESEPESDSEGDEIENLILQAAREQAEEEKRREREEIRLRKETMRRKSDKQYEDYWRRQGKRGMNDQALMKQYYSLGKNETIASKVYSSDSRISDRWDYSAAPVSSKDIGTTALSFGAVLSGIVLSKRFSFKRLYSYSGSSGAAWNIRNIRKDYSYTDLLSSAKAALADVNSLPSLPESISELQAIRGTNPFSPSSTEALPIVTVVVLWRPSDVVSVRAVAAFSQFEKLFPSAVRLVTVLSPRYAAELSIGVGEGGHSLLLESEIPDSILVDPKNEFLRASQVGSLPTVFLSTDRKIIFAMENQRAIGDVNGRALAAVLGAKQVQSPSAQEIIKSWVSTPLLKNGNRESAADYLKHPTRMAFNYKTKLLYISDTGNHRVLEVKVTQSDGSFAGTVIRTIGSRTGEPGPAVPGCKFEDIKFNKPMGIGIDPDEGGVLYVADSGNDAIRRVQLGSTTSSRPCVTISGSSATSPIDYNDFPQLEAVQKALGITMRQAMDFTSDELRDLITEAFASGKMKNIDKDNIYIGQFLGRSRSNFCPTDIGKCDAVFYVSSAGSRQIWKIEDRGIAVKPIFGSGVIGRRDSDDLLSRLGLERDAMQVQQASIPLGLEGGFLADRLRFIQPMGLTAGGANLFIVDSDGATIRTVNLVEGYSRTVAGSKSDSILGSSEDSDAVNLIENFGDSDGVGSNARFQYPTASSGFDSPDKILVTDTLNNKVKVVSIKGKSARVHTLCSQLNYPQGVVYDREKRLVYVANTGADEIVVVEGDKKKVLQLNFSST
jgi:DNA-binding beta-propeller fold protein YncE